MTKPKAALCVSQDLSFETARNNAQDDVLDIGLRSINQWRVRRVNLWGGNCSQRGGACRVWKRWRSWKLCDRTKNQFYSKGNGCSRAVSHAWGISGWHSEDVVAQQTNKNLTSRVKRFCAGDIGPGTPLCNWINARHTLRTFGHLCSCWRVGKEVASL